MPDNHRRRPNRLKSYDYSTPGAYFITICTENRKKLLWQDVGASIARPQAVTLSKMGKIVDIAIRSIPIHYPAVSVDRYVIMPNHLHLLLQICTDDNGQQHLAEAVPRSRDSGSNRLRHHLGVYRE